MKNHKMTAKDWEFLNEALMRFNHKGNIKFPAGKREHGGSITEYPIPWHFDQIEDEIVDLWMYIQALRGAINEDA